jgi:glutamine synthetase
MWCDLNGLSHGRYVPSARLHEHGHHAVTTLTMGINRDIIPVDGYGPDVGFADLATVPLQESVRPGWEVDTDVAIADLEYNGEPLALCPRGALKRAVDAWKSLGYEPQLGFEMEFYLMQPDPDLPGGYGPLHLPSHRVYGVGMGGDNTGVMFDLYDAAEQCELDLEALLRPDRPSGGQAAT